MVSGNIAEFLVNQRDQRFQRVLIPDFPAHEQLGHRMWRLLRHRRLRSMRVAVKIARHSGLVNEDGTNGRMIPLVALPQKIPAFRECF
jgi:hypothetical protein